MIRIFLQYKEFLKYFYENQISGVKVRPQISITGGEPFLHNDFMDFLKILSTNKDFFFICILTNGTLITKEIAKMGSEDIKKYEKDINNTGVDTSQVYLHLKLKEKDEGEHRQCSDGDVPEGDAEFHREVLSGVQIVVYRTVRN